MVEFGQYPLVYQLLNGVPVGIAEASSIIVSSVSANTYQGLTGTISFTGVVQIGDATSVGTSLIDNDNPNYPLIKPLTANTDGFVGFTPGGGTVEIGWAGSPLPISRGGTNATDVAGAQIALNLVPNSDIQQWNPNLQELSDLTIADKQILVGGPIGSLTVITAPTTDNTFLKYNAAGGGAFSWAAGGSVSYPDFPGRIPYISDSTTLASQPWLNIETGTGRFNVCEVYGSVSIIVGNTDTTVTRLSAGDLQIGTNRIFRVGGADIPVADGGTGKSAFNANQIIYGDTFGQSANLTFDGTTLKSSNSSSINASADTIFENGENISSKYLTQTAATTNYLSKSNFNTWSGALALSAGLLDVQIAALSSGQVLKWNGNYWANAADTTGAGVSVTDYRTASVEGFITMQNTSPPQFNLRGEKPTNNYPYKILGINAAGNTVLLEFGGVAALTDPSKFTLSSANYFSALLIDELSSVDHWNENSYIFYAEVNTLSAINLSATNYYNLPSVTALNGTGVFEVTSYSRNNFVLTGTNLALSNTISNHIASAVHWELSTLNDNYINASGDSANSSFFLQNLSATTFSATNYYNLPSSTVVWANATNATNAQTIRKYVKNSTGATIPKGRAVTVIGATGDNVLIAPLSSVNTHVPEAIGLSNHVFGLTETQILNDDFGYIITEGIVSGTGGGVNALDTSLFAAGDILYVSSNGLLTNTRPTPPYESHPIGYVIRSQSNTGSIYVKIETQPEINDIVGFNLASSLINGDLINYDLTTSTFVNTQSINVSGLIKGGSLSATNLSATNARITSLSATTLSATSYLNLPSTALSGLSDTLITSPALSSVLKWNGSKWVPATDQTGGGGGTPTGGQYAIQVNDGAAGFYGDASLVYDYDANTMTIGVGDLSVNSPVTFNSTFLVAGTAKAATVSATTYLNLPSGVATWNANKLQGVTVTSTAPVATQHLEYDGTAWKPEWNSVSTINSTVTLTNTCDEKLFVSSSGSKVTVTLPDPTTCAGKEIQLIKSDPSGIPVYVSAATLQSPGNLIAMRIPRDMVQVISDGTNWYIQHNNSSYGGSHEVGTYDVEFEDFIWGSTESGEVGIRNWSFTNGTVATVNNTGADGTGRGVINRQSGTTANQVASMYPSNAGTNTTNFANEVLDFKIRQFPTTITSYKIRFGMFSDMTADPPASGIYFECSSGQSNYQAITRNGAVETKTDTAVAVDAAAFSTFRIFRRSDSAIEFYINDNIVATNTANIPSQHAITFGYQCIPTTTTAKGSNIDYISVAIVDTTQRY